MAKSSRASSRKANNQRLKKHVFGPVEAARLERLSEKLLEIAAQPKPQRDAEMKTVDGMLMKRGTKNCVKLALTILRLDSSSEPVQTASSRSEHVTSMLSPSRHSLDSPLTNITTEMDIDSTGPSSRGSGKSKIGTARRVQKKRPSRIVFPRYKDQKTKRSK